MKKPLPDILQSILRDKMQWVQEQQLRLPEAEMRQQAEAVQTDTRGFAAALNATVQAGRPAVIAEIKKASPSAGVIREPFEPPVLARSYHEAGAACLSVLTDEPWFQGRDAHLIAARAACPLPVLRKDFILTPWQLDQSRVLGADCVLLIVAALEQKTLACLYQRAEELGLDVLLEVHSREELRRALDLGPKLLGINNRNLHNFSVSLDTTLQLLDEVPDSVQVVTESGIRSREDVLMMQQQGIHTFLVGESLLRTPDPGASLRELFFSAA